MTEMFFAHSKIGNQFRKLLLAAQKPRLVNHVNAGMRTADHGKVFQKRQFQRLFRIRLLHIQQTRNRLDEFPARHADVSGKTDLRQRVGHA